jgi:hypothetical protein
MLDRFTLEFYASVVIAIAIALVSMPWWAQAAFFLILCGFIVDISFHAPWMVRHNRFARAGVCLVSVGLVLSVGIRSVLAQYHIETSHEDLRASFFIETRGENRFNIEYSFVNEGKHSASISSVGLTEVVESNRIDEPESNVNLCANANSARLLITRLLGHLGLANLGSDGIKSQTYSPKELSVDGKPWQSDAPIAVEGGESRTISAIYEIDPTDPTKYNVMALCPVVEAYDDIGLGGTTVCKGMVLTRTEEKLSSVRSAERVRILPHARDVLCPSAN